MSMNAEEEKMLRAIHQFLIEPRGPKLPSRAEEIDSALDAVRAGKIGARAVLWLAGFISAVGAAWLMFRGIPK